MYLASYFTAAAGIQVYGFNPRPAALLIRSKTVDVAARATAVFQRLCASARSKRRLERPPKFSCNKRQLKAIRYYFSGT